MGLARQGSEFGIKGTNVSKGYCVLISVVDESDFSLLFDGRCSPDFGAVPGAIREFGRDEVTTFGYESGRRAGRAVMDREFAHEFL
jgi:hypothetical protein